MDRLRTNLYILLLLLISTCAWAREPMRGAWIATVANIDWPSHAAVGNTELQQTEMCGILDSLQQAGINTIILQVRPTADALYLSEMEPVSHWLTGKQGSWNGQEPYDPLEWTVREAHLRGLDVHVWINPYRVNLPKTGISQLSRDHIYRQHPEWFWCYADQWYFDPGLDVTRQWICQVVHDIVSRYDIQAVHMDDYFYPYPSGGKPLPDQATFERYPRGYTNIADWRRNNVNMAIRDISETIRRTKPNVEFGISPFGVWRNQAVDSTGSATRAGICNYDHLYADTRLWIKEGWIDYIAPQLYWEIGKTIANYEVLAHWWVNEVRGTRCKLYLGMAVYRLREQKGRWAEGNEIMRQLRLNRQIEGIDGEILYSTRPLLSNPRHVYDSVSNFYKQEYEKDSITIRPGLPDVSEQLPAQAD